MKPYKGGIRHDYKDPYDASLVAPRERHWSAFVLGLALPVASVTLFMIGSAKDSGSDAHSQNEIAASIAHLGDLEPASVLKRSDPEDSHSAGALVDAVDQFAAGLKDSDSGDVDAAESRVTEADVADGLIADAAELESTVADAAASMLELVVQPGDTLERLFRRHHLSLTDLAAMVRLDEVAEHLKLVRPGDTITVRHRDGEVLSLLRQIDRFRMLSIARAETGFDASTLDLPVETKERVAHGEIRSSLFGAAMTAGMSDALTMSMAGIFQWDIDFIQDVRVGDTFTVIYEEHYRDGEKLGDGPVLAAEFVNRGNVFRAVRYTDDTGRSDYFTPEGRSLRKAFIRAPVDFTRISSNFDLNRRHPVLNTIRAHKGVDYAAPTGTPVRAAGDGKVAVRGRDGGYGNVVVLEHGGNITTLYAHLSRFGRFNVGSRVKQGDVIGYVGATGLATGPHLHYEYRVNGVHRNPRTVDLPPADPVPEALRADFEAKSAPLWQRLDDAQATRYATTAAR